MKNPFITYSIFLAAVFLWCGMILLAPLASYSGFAREANFLYTFFSRVCHQFDSHSLHLCGEKLGVCARCSAMYFGFFLGIVVYPLFRPLSDASLPHRRWFVIAAIPMCFDVFLATFGIHPATLLTRLFTGGVFGFIIAFTIIPGLIMAVSSLSSSSARHYADKTR